MTWTVELENNNDVSGNTIYTAEPLTFEDRTVKNTLTVKITRKGFYFTKDANIKYYRDFTRVTLPLKLNVEQTIGTATIPANELSEHSGSYKIIEVWPKFYRDTTYSITKNLENCTCDAPDFTKPNVKVSYTVTSNEGYLLYNVTSNVGTVTVSSDKKTATITGYIDKDMVINARASSDEPKTPITINTDNMSNSTLSPTSANYGDTVTFTLTANDGYLFTGNTPYLSYSNSLHSDVTKKFTISEDTKTATATLDTSKIGLINDAYTLNVYASPKALVTSYTITKTLNNCTSDIPDTIDDGTHFTYTITATEGYEFLDNSVTSNIGTVSIDTSKTTATVTGTATGNITITANATQKETPKETVNIKAGTLENCTYSPNSATYGDTITITITAEDNYAFTTATPYIKYVGPLSQIVNHKFTLNSDKTIGTYSLDTTQIKKLNDSYTVTVYGTPTYQQGTTVSEMYTIYKVSNKDLQKVSNKRFLNVAGNDSAYYEPLINYINSLYRLPLVFNDLPTQALILKNITVLNKASVIPNTKYEYTLGEVTLPKHFNTSNDYNNTYYLTLPYYGVYTLDNTKCLNSVLTIKATVDIISGDCVYTIIRDSLPIDSIRCNIKENLPYMTRDKEVLSNNITVNMFELPPKIACYYHAITNSFVSNDKNETIKNLNYFKADKIIKSDNIPKKYIELIENELRKGVFKNEL